MSSASLLAAKHVVPTQQAAANLRLGFTPVRLPHPLPIYQQSPNFLVQGVGGFGSVLQPAVATGLPAYEVVDDVVLPPEFEYYMILKWGDRVYRDRDQYCGFNHDWTGIVPLDRTGRLAILWVNHEYTSDPWRTNSNKILAANGFGADYLELDPSVNPVQVAGEVLYNVGGSEVLLRRNLRGKYQVVSGHGRNRRWHGLSGLGIANPAGGRPDGKTIVSGWGPRPHQQADNDYLEGTGPAATDVFANSVDGLGNKIIGTNSNCSGGQTPWGTFISCEENFQFTAREDVDPNGNQVGYNAGSLGDTFGLVGEKYGWNVEFDPRLTNTQGYYPKKHTSLGRFRHENITFWARRGRKLVAYMGDDRRGGHTWKWVSEGVVRNPRDPNNSRLLESGTLYVAKYEADGTGRWIPLDLSTPINPNVPSDIASVEITQLGTAQRDGRVRLPQRNGVGSGTQDGGSLIVDTTNEATEIPAYQAAGTTLADFYNSQGAVLCDAFLAANLVGGTPTGRPEDLEVSPMFGRDVFIAYTDGIAGGDGYADSRIMTVNTYDAAPDAEQPSGALFKVREDRGNDVSSTFTWSKFAKSGEAGADEGTGFANLDNLAFDRSGNIWGVTDMSTSRQNTIRTGPNPSTRTINHSEAGDFDEEVGVFGNNWVFYIPTRGPMAGEVIPFGYGPVKCEMTGPTFFRDTLVISVQHPGESMPTDEQIDLDPRGPVYPPIDIEMLDLDGTLFNQRRTVPLSSEWPREITGNQRRLPQPATIGIRRRIPVFGEEGEGFLAGGPEPENEADAEKFEQDV